jgi:hypothetical protein
MSETDFSSNFLTTFRTLFHKKVRDPLLPPTVLKEFVNRDFVFQSGNKVRVFMWPTVSPNEGSWSSRNDYEKITRQSGQPTYEEFTIDEYFDYNVAMSIQDEKLTELPSLANNLARQVRRQMEQKAEIDIASNFLFTDIDNIISDTTKDTTVDGAVTAGATTFDVASGDGSNLAAGDIAFIEATDGKTAPVLVKSVSTDTITIEDNEANFPTGPGGKKFFKKLLTALPAISNGATVKTDAPVTVSKTTYYDQLVELWDKPLEKDIPAGGFVTFAPLAVTRLLKKDDSVLLKNDFLGKEIIVNGQVRDLGGNMYYNSNNGISRVVNGVTRYYPWVQKSKQSVIHVDYLSSSAIDRIQETAGTVMSASGLAIYQSKVIKNHGQQSMAFSSVKIG